MTSSFSLYVIINTTRQRRPQQHMMETQHVTRKPRHIMMETQHVTINPRHIERFSIECRK